MWGVQRELMCGSDAHFKPDRPRICVNPMNAPSGKNWVDLSTPWWRRPCTHSVSLWGSSVSMTDEAAYFRRWLQ